MVTRTRTTAKKTATVEPTKEVQVEHAKRYGSVAEIREYVENPPKGAKYSRAMVVRLLEEVERLEKVTAEHSESREVEALKSKNEVLSLVLSGATAREVLEKALTLLGMEPALVLNSLKN